MNVRFFAVFAFFTAAAFSASAGDLRTASPGGADVYFIALQSGATVSSPVTVIFGLKGMGVAPAGVEKPKTGHHHLLIDTALKDYENAVPSDKMHRHFGGGQTKTTIPLSPGTHTLQLVLGDHNHIPHKPPVQSKRITITVK